MFHCRKCIPDLRQSTVPVTDINVEASFKIRVLFSFPWQWPQCVCLRLHEQIYRLAWVYQVRYEHLFHRLIHTYIYSVCFLFSALRWLHDERWKNLSRQQELAWPQTSREEWALYKEMGVAVETGNNTAHCHTPHPTTLLWQPENDTRWAESATRKSPGKSVGKRIACKQQ